MGERGKSIYITYSRKTGNLSNQNSHSNHPCHRCIGTSRRKNARSKPASCTSEQHVSWWINTTDFHSSLLVPLVGLRDSHSFITEANSPMSEENTATNTSLTALLAKAKAKRVSDCCKHPPNYTYQIHILHHRLALSSLHVFFYGSLLLLCERFARSDARSISAQPMHTW